MDIREKLDEALKDLSVADEEMLDAFFAFTNEHLEQAVQAVNEINQMLREIKQFQGTPWALGLFSPSPARGRGLG